MLKLKSDKGMGYIQVIIIIIFIAVVVAGSIYFLRIQLNERYIETIKTNMLLIQWRAREYKDEKTVAGEEIVYIGTKVSDMQDDYIVADIIQKQLLKEDKYDKYYVLKDEDLEALAVDVRNEEESYYIINYEDLDIIISKGCKYDEERTLYRLSDIETTAEEAGEEKNEEEENSTGEEQKEENGETEKQEE